MVKSLKFIIKSGVFDGLEGCMCERYGYQQNITSKTEIHSNTNENQCENDCRTNDTNMKEKGANMDPKREPESRAT